MNDIYFKLKASKTDKSGRAPIFLEFNHDAETLVFATGEKCHPTQWDFEKQKFRRSMPGYQEANEGLERLRDKLRKVYRDARNSGEATTNERLRELLSPSPAPIAKSLPVLFSDYLDHCLSINYKPSTLKSMGVTGGRIRGFITHGGQLSVSSYTADTHKRFLNYLIIDLKLHPNSVANTCKHLRAFFNWCQKALNLDLSPNHAEIKTEWMPSERVFLTESELVKLQTVPLSVAMSRVRDAFLFQCYTGLRYAELSRLDKSHIEQREGYKVLTFIPEKSVSVRVRSAKRVEVPLLPGAIQILERYEGNYRLLPILSNQKMNDYIKDIAKAAGIDTPVEQIIFESGIPKLTTVPKYDLISSHIARHTFATLSLSKGVPLELVSKTLGHTELKTTMIYAKIEDEYKNHTILKAWQDKE